MAIFLISHLEIWKMAIFYGIKLPFMLLHHEIVLYASKVFSTSIGSFPSNLPISTVLSQTLSLKPTFAPLVNDLPNYSIQNLVALSIQIYCPNINMTASHFI